MNRQEIEEKIKSLTEVMNQNLINSTVVEPCLDKIDALQKELDNLPDYPTKKGEKYILVFNPEFVYEVLCFWCNNDPYDSLEEWASLNTPTESILIENTMNGHNQLDVAKLITV